MTSTSEKRQGDRYPVRISCELTISGQTQHAEMKNLSSGGAAIVFERPLTTGEVITVGFYLTQDGIEDPDRSPFECAASIRWSKPVGGSGHEAGLQFLSPSSEQRRLLEDFLRRAS